MSINGPVYSVNIDIYGLSVPNTFFEIPVFETKFELTVAILRICRFPVFQDQLSFKIAVFELPVFKIKHSSHINCNSISLFLQ